MARALLTAGAALAAALGFLLGHSQLWAIRYLDAEMDRRDAEQDQALRDHLAAVCTDALPNGWASVLITQSPGSLDVSAPNMDPDHLVALLAGCTLGAMHRRDAVRDAVQERLPEMWRVGA